MRRRSFEGVWNIIRFNWQFYLIVVLLFISSFFLVPELPQNIQFTAWLVVWGAFVAMIVSLMVSYFIYDYSDLYGMKWLSHHKASAILNIHAGFDEAIHHLNERYPHLPITIADFYNPNLHTEISIERARRAYPPHPETIQIESSHLPFKSHSFDTIVVFLAAHEIRHESERIAFFKELKRVLTPDGRVYVTEHVRDFNNLLAYTIGVFHFHSRATWLRAFSTSELSIIDIHKTTPFITTFTLQHHGATL
jgi:ubiquinone/menaquinone biosynthesis C-methylase UbiE